MKLLIIQPWFSAVGHPAQSLINMANAIGKLDEVDYLVSTNCAPEFSQVSVEKLKTLGNVISYSVATSVGESNTVRALFAVWRMQMRGQKYQRIFFFDESLFVLALLWPIFALLVPVERLGVLHLFGPRVEKNAWLEKIVVGKFLKRREVKLYLRTHEMAAAWRESYKEVILGQIDYLPSLEIPDEEQIRQPQKLSDEMAFGILGQIRVGKGIEWLVPMFQGNPSLGRLTVAGEFNTSDTRERLSVLNEYDGFSNSYMTEDQMLARAVEQDYLLMLYDQWDKRMESAVIYLAARVNTPVIVYGDSWCGRMVKEFGCGIVAPAEHEKMEDFLMRVPHPSSDEYQKLLKGMDEFRQAYSVKSLRVKVLHELLG